MEGGRSQNAVSLLLYYESSPQWNAENSRCFIMKYAGHYAVSYLSGSFIKAVERRTKYAKTRQWRQYIKYGCSKRRKLWLCAKNHVQLFPIVQLNHWDFHANEGHVFSSQPPDGRIRLKGKYTFADVLKPWHA